MSRGKRKAAQIAAITLTVCLPMAAALILRNCQTPGKATEDGSGSEETALVPPDGEYEAGSEESFSEEGQPEKSAAEMSSPGTEPSAAELSGTETEASPAPDETSVDASEISREAEQETPPAVRTDGTPPSVIRESSAEAQAEEEPATEALTEIPAAPQEPQTVSESMSAGTSDAPSFTETPEETPAAETVHEHVWLPVTEVVHHEAETVTVRHDAVSEERWVVDRPAGEERIPGFRCFYCGQFWEASEAADESILWDHVLAHPGGDETGPYGGFASWGTDVLVVPFEEEGHWETFTAEAYDETILLRPAWDETVVTGWRCPECGAER